jgi:hypothetical protein
MKSMLVALASLLQLPLILLGLWLGDRLGDRLGVWALIGAIVAPPLAFAGALAWSSPQPWAWSAAMAPLGAVLTCATSAALLAWCKRVGLLTFVWGDEHGGALFGALVLVMLGCWGALTVLAGSLLHGALVAWGVGTSGWLYTAYGELTHEHRSWRKRLGNVVTGTIVSCLGPLPALFALGWFAA